MGWLILLLFAAATLAALVWIARPGRQAIELVVALLLVAVAGYAWQGRPGLAGKPTAARASHPTQDVLFAEERVRWLGKVGRDNQLLDTADNFIRGGDAAYAIGVLRGELSRRPDSMILWIGLGNALVSYADGAVTPPARFAFQRAGAIAPAHPAPAYFLALEYAQGGDLDTAEGIWRQLLATSPADAPWRPWIEEKLQIAAQLRRMVR